MDVLVPEVVVRLLMDQEKLTYTEVNTFNIIIGYVYTTTQSNLTKNIHTIYTACRLCVCVCVVVVVVLVKPLLVNYADRLNKPEHMTR